MNETKTRLLWSLACVALLVLVNGAATQFVAHRLSYHSALGDPLFFSLYNPFVWWEWMYRFKEYSPETYSFALLIVIIGTALSILSCNLAIGFGTRSSKKHEGTHGTARFATVDDVKNSGLLNRTGGVYCGGFDDEERTLYLRHKGDEHICVFAPTGSGKGVGLVIPTLLSWLESVIVLDIKGENYATTAGWRKKHANNLVLKFDPSADISCSWNPLGEIRFKTSDQISDAQNIALMVVDTDGKGLTDHWKSAAHSLITGVILYALYMAKTIGREPNLMDCAHMLMGVGDFTPVSDEPSSDEFEEKLLSSLFEAMKGISIEEEMDAQVFIRGIGTRMSNTAYRELASIVSTANNALSLYCDPKVGKNTSRSDFKISDLMDHDKPVSLYFITTPENLLRLRPLIRLLITRVIAGLTGEMEFVDGRSKAKHKNKLLLMLDEFPSLGKLDMFQSALAFIRGYGIKAYIICQDIQQLYEAYTPNQSITSNCHIRIAYAPTELKTAEMLSKMCGQTTVINEQISVSGKRFGGAAEQFSSSFHSSQRPLMTPDEVQRLPLTKVDENGNVIEIGKLLVFVAGERPILGTHILYYRDQTFNERSKIAPPAISDIVRHECAASVVAI